MKPRIGSHARTNVSFKVCPDLQITATPARTMRLTVSVTPNLPTNIVGFRRFDSSIILNLRDGIPRPIGNFLESLSQAMLVGVMLVGDWA